jgi:hypothetical protein
MDEGIPEHGISYHLIVALFDEATGRRIGDADVTAHVFEPGKPGLQKKLEPMIMAGIAGYGNFFRVPGAGPYRVVLRIQAPELTGAIEVEFEYLRART